MAPQKGWIGPWSSAVESFVSTPEKRIVTDGGEFDSLAAKHRPSGLGYEILFVLEDNERLTATVLSAVRTEFHATATFNDVEHALRALASDGLVTQDDEHRWTITADGEAVARERHRTITDLRATRTGSVRGVQGGDR